MNRLRKIIADVIDADWILRPESVASQPRPSPARLRAAQRRIMFYDEVYSDAERAKAEAWRVPS
jgi:hypothetical protein